MECFCVFAGFPFPTNNLLPCYYCTGAGVVVDVVVSVIAGPVLVSDGAKTKQHMYPI